MEDIRSPPEIKIHYKIHCKIKTYYKIKIPTLSLQRTEGQGWEHRLTGNIQIGDMGLTNAEMRVA